jgi:hypothetical protein
LLAAQHHVEDTIGSARMLSVTLAEIELVEQLARQSCGEMHAARVCA